MFSSFNVSEDVFTVAQYDLAGLEACAATWFTTNAMSIWWRAQDREKLEQLAGKGLLDLLYHHGRGCTVQDDALIKQGL